GQRRVDLSDDFVAAEIAAALARNISVIPVLVDGGGVPKESWLPVPLKPLVRRQAVEPRGIYFDRDVDALVERGRQSLSGSSVGVRWWRGTAMAGVAAAAGLLLIGVGSYALLQQGRKQPEPKLAEEPKAIEAQADSTIVQAEQQGLSTIKPEQDRHAPATAAEA